MARPMSTEQAMGAPVCAPLVRIVMREVVGSARYCSFRGFCSDRRSMATSLVRQVVHALRAGFGRGFLKPLHLHASMPTLPENAHAKVCDRTRCSRSRRSERRAAAGTLAEICRGLERNGTQDPVAA